MRVRRGNDWEQMGCFWKEDYYIFVKYIQFFKPKQNDIGGFKVKTNKELNTLFDKANIIGIIKTRRITFLEIWRSGGEHKRLKAEYKTAQGTTQTTVAW